MAQKESFADGQLDELFLTIANLIYETEMAHGSRFWPFHPVRLHRLIANHFFRELHRLIRGLEQDGFSIAQIAALVYNPNKVADYNLMWSSVTELSEEDMYYLASRMVQILHILRHGDPFCTSGASLVWSNQEAQDNIERSIFVTADGDPLIAGLLSRLETVLTSYAELLYYMFPGFSRMYHGPYLLKDSTVFVKEFLDLRPAELWPEAQRFPFDRYQSIGQYDPGITIKVYFIGLFELHVPFAEALKRFSLKLDTEQVITRETLQGYCDSAESVVNSVLADISRLDEDTLLRKGADMFFYTLHRLYDALGTRCEVLPQVYAAIEGRARGSEPFKPLDDLSREEAIDRLLNSVDFRRR
jgi:hypothetical protein